MRGLGVLAERAPLDPIAGVVGFSILAAALIIVGLIGVTFARKIVSGLKRLYGPQDENSVWAMRPTVVKARVYSVVMIAMGFFCLGGVAFHAARL